MPVPRLSRELTPSIDELVPARHDVNASRARKDEFVNSGRKLAYEASDGHAEAITQWCHCRAWPTEVGPCRRLEIPSRRLVVFRKNYPFFSEKWAISALPIWAFRACGCCWPMPQTCLDYSSASALLPLAVVVLCRRVPACAHSTVATPAGNVHSAC